MILRELRFEEQVAYSHQKWGQVFAADDGWVVEEIARGRVSLQHPELCPEPVIFEGWAYSIRGAVLQPIATDLATPKAKMVAKGRNG